MLERQGGLLAAFDNVFALRGQRQPRVFPQFLFFGMGAAVVTSRDERRFGLSDSSERPGWVLHAFDACRVFCRTDNDEVIVHHRIPFCSITFGDEFFLSRLGVDKDDVHIAVHAVADGCPSPFGEDFHFDPRILCEFREKHIQKAGVLRARCGGHFKDFRAAHSWARHHEKKENQDKSAQTSLLHFYTLLCKNMI